MKLDLDPQKVLRVASHDDVAVALHDLAAGSRLTVAGNPLACTADIGKGHKSALHAIAAGSTVTKFGFPIGRANIDIAASDWVHSHNLETGLSCSEEYRYAPLPAREFLCFRRADDRVGTR